MNVLRYSYYDTPEGKDCFPKLLYTTKYAAVAGLGVSTFDVLMYSHPKGYFQTMARFAHFTVPFVSMAAAFTMTTCLANSLRHKDDKINYFIGGCSSAAVLGAWRKSAYLGFVGCVVLGGIAMLKKASIEDGWEFFPSPKGHMLGSLRGVRHDYTLSRDPPRGWTTTQE